MSAARSYGADVASDVSTPITAPRTLRRRLSARERSVLARHLEHLRRDLREEFRRARFAVGYARERRRQLATEDHAAWRDYCRAEIKHALPYIARHRAEIRHLRGAIANLTEAMRSL